MVADEWRGEEEISRRLHVCVRLLGMGIGMGWLLQDVRCVAPARRWHEHKAQSMKQQINVIITERLCRKLERGLWCICGGIDWWPILWSVSVSVFVSVSVSVYGPSRRHPDDAIFVIPPRLTVHSGRIRLQWRSEGERLMLCSLPMHINSLFALLPQTLTVSRLVQRSEASLGMYVPPSLRSNSPRIRSHP